MTLEQISRAGGVSVAATEALRSLHADGWTLGQLAAATDLTSRAIPATSPAAIPSRLRAERAGWEPSTPQPDDLDLVTVDRVVRGDVVPLRVREVADPKSMSGCRSIAQDL
jgi:hypothetical protein